MTTAVQIQTIEKKLSTQSISYDVIKTMDAEDLVVFIRSLSQNYPDLYEEFQSSVDDLENAPFSSVITKQTADKSGPQPNADNQTLLEKIFWKIYNYRVIRLLISTLLFIKFQSKFTLWRTMTWGIRLLRWIKVGILLGFIDLSQQPPLTPNIVFQQDLGNDTLIVSYASANVQWSDIAEIGEGGCDPLPEGNVTAGDMITSCTGIIVLQYVPTYEILGVFEFD
jgi:hypothetical protein